MPWINEENNTDTKTKELSFVCISFSFYQTMANKSLSKSGETARIYLKNQKENTETFDLGRKRNWSHRTKVKHRKARDRIGKGEEHYRVVVAAWAIGVILLGEEGIASDPLAPNCADLLHPELSFKSLFELFLSNLETSCLLYGLWESETGLQCLGFCYIDPSNIANLTIFNNFCHLYLMTISYNF